MKTSLACLGFWAVMLFHPVASKAATIQFIIQGTNYNPLDPSDAPIPFDIRFFLYTDAPPISAYPDFALYGPDSNSLGAEVRALIPGRPDGYDALYVVPLIEFIGNLYDGEKWISNLKLEGLRQSGIIVGAGGPSFETIISYRSISYVPTPGSFLLFASGLAGLLLLLRSLRKKSVPPFIQHRAIGRPISAMAPT